MPYEAGDRDSDESVNDNLRPLMYDQAAEVEHPDYTVAEVNNHKARSASSSSQGRGRVSLSSASAAGAALSRSTTSSEAVDLEARAVHSPLTSRVAATPVLTSAPARTESIDRMGNLSKEEWQVFPDDMYALTDNKYTKAELTARTPWAAFFTDPVAQGLLVCAFVYVSDAVSFVFVHFNMSG